MKGERGREERAYSPSFLRKGEWEELFIHPVHRPIPSVFHPFLIQLLAPRPFKLEAEIVSAFGELKLTYRTYSSPSNLMVSHSEWGPRHTRDWEPVTIAFQALSLVEKVELVQVCFTLRLRDQRCMWMRDGYKSLYGFLHGIDWIMFHGHLDYFKKPRLGVGLTQNHETMVFRMLPTVDLFYFIMREDLHVWNFIEIAICWEPSHIWRHSTLEDR